MPAVPQHAFENALHKHEMRRMAHATRHGMCTASRKTIGGRLVRSGVAEAEKKAGAPVHNDLAHALTNVAQVERRGAREGADEELEQERRQLLLSREKPTVSQRPSRTYTK
jgi:hypothetical protein